VRTGRRHVGVRPTLRGGACSARRKAGLRAVEARQQRTRAASALRGARVNAVRLLGFLAADVSKCPPSRRCRETYGWTLITSCRPASNDTPFGTPRSGCTSASWSVRTVPSRIWSQRSRSDARTELMSTAPAIAKFEPSSSTKRATPSPSAARAQLLPEMENSTSMLARGTPSSSTHLTRNVVATGRAEGARERGVGAGSPCAGRCRRDRWRHSAREEAKNARA
jgi:hypothetical protein